MSVAIQPLSPDLKLPWSPSEEQEGKFRNNLIVALLILLVLFVMVPWLPVFENLYEKPEKPVVKTKLLLKKTVVKAPTKNKPKEEPKKAKPKKAKPKKSKQGTKEKGKQKNTSKTIAQKKPKPNTKAALSKSQGMAKISNDLSALRGALNVKGLKKKATSNSTKGKLERSSQRVIGQNSSTKTLRGIKVNDEIMKSSVTRLASHKTKHVEGIVGLDEPGKNSDKKAQSFGTSSEPTRDMESIRSTIEKHKSAVYALYNKALSKNPDINGQFIFRLVIDPSGKIINLTLVSSELGASDLEEKMLSRIKNIKFGKMDVIATSVEYRFVFLPS